MIGGEEAACCYLRSWRQGESMPNRCARIAAVVGVVLGLLVVVAGPASAHIPRVKKPSPPTSVVATPRSPNTIEVSWASPVSDGGSAITGYTVTAENTSYVSNNIHYPDVSCTAADTATSCFLGGYTPSLYYYGCGYGNNHPCDYRLSVVAMNSVGTSRPVKLRSTTADPSDPICSYIGPYAFPGTSCGITNWSGVDLQDAWLLEESFVGANLTGTNLTGAVMETAEGFTGAIWSNTTCPDGTNSDNDGGTCVNNLNR
jgi:Fibronectin type III domain/Pentapeptide repeats (8 copies)